MHDVLTCMFFFDTTDAPKGLMDSGKAFLAYFDAIKKEYDVSCLNPHGFLSVSTEYFLLS